MTQSDSWRQSTRAEIKQYYTDIFPEKVSELPAWITPNGPKQYALAFREDHPARMKTDDGEEKIVGLNFVRRSTRSDYDDGDTVFIEDWDTILSFFQRPAARDPFAIATNRAKGLIHPDNSDVTKPEPAEPAPAAAYYALDHWDQYWRLAFDIDAKDVAKQQIATGNQTYEDVSDEQVENAGFIDTPPQPHTLSPEQATGVSEGSGSVIAYPYRYSDIRRSLQYAFELKEWLLDTVGFEEARVFYTGQGAHVYVHSDDPYYKYTHQSRRYIATYIKERLNIPVDAQVTWDKQRVMRLPLSLHTDVNRVVTEIQSPDFDFKTKALPETVTQSMEGDQQ